MGLSRRIVDTGLAMLISAMPLSFAKMNDNPLQSNGSMLSLKQSIDKCVPYIPVALQFKSNDFKNGTINYFFCPLASGQPSRLIINYDQNEGKSSVHHRLTISKFSRYDRPFGSSNADNITDEQSNKAPVFVPASYIIGGGVDPFNYFLENFVEPELGVIVQRRGLSRQ